MNAVNIRRRSILKGGLAAGSLFLPTPYVLLWAQSGGTKKLLSVPKLALVIGNSNYKEAPLRNPANDANAMAEALRSLGFEVTLRMDAGKAEMSAAVQAYVQALAARKCVGLFYYAGHGVQLAWRNYMLPVDADIDTIGDIQKQGVEVNALLEGVTKAANPMNMVILDACRDNPFGNLKGVDHKGLSQMDAPSHTLLAYATSPGNVASDGDGTNGLYTENLLRELRVPEAKVEEVFKRVRLGVRVKSKGAQIPWECTSLEDDFWFIPPKELKWQSEAERERAFKEELSTWERIRRSPDPGPFEEYLRRYPNGNFAEIAQLQLNRVLAKQGEKPVHIVSQEGNPYTKGSATANTNYKVGDTYSYRVLDLYSKVERSRHSNTLVEVTENELRFSGDIVLDLLGNWVRLSDGRSFTPNQTMPLEYVVGKRWSTRYEVTSPRFGYRRGASDFEIVARESVTVPAGTFNAFRIEARGHVGGEAESTTFWVDPDRCRRPVLRDQRSKESTNRLELVSFKEG